jgi:hypothetical protein
MQEFKMHDTVYFLHIPKTSGTALHSPQITKLGHNFSVPGVYRTPADRGGFHGYDTCTWGVYAYPETPNTKISIIRNPFDLLCSYYHHGDALRADGGYCHSGWASVNYTHQFATFKQFIAAYCDPAFAWHQPQFQRFLFSQLFDASHRCVADVLMKYEFLDEAIDLLNAKLRHPIAKRVANVSHRKTGSYRDHYDAEMVELVRAKCARELACFRYDFDGSTTHEPLILHCPVRYDVHADRLLDAQPEARD